MKIFLAISFQMKYSDFASGEHHHGTAPTGRGPGKVPASKPLLSSEARKGRLTVSEAEQVRSPRPKGARRLEQADYGEQVIEN